MANRTVKDAKSVRGTNPQFLIEKIIRSRIYESKYWKEECFALSAELIVDKAMELRFIGGVFGGNIKPTPFLCLTLKMLQIQPEKDIIVEFIKNEEFKYVRALGALYMRLVGTSVECYKYLEPLFNDGRKLRRQNRSGEYEVIHMDDFIDELLREERSCDVILPRIQKRYVLEEANEMEPRISGALDEDIDEPADSSDDDEPDRDDRRPEPRGDRREDRREDRRPEERRDDRVREERRDRDRRPERERHRRSRSRERRHRSRSPRPERKDVRENRETRETRENRENTRDVRKQHRREERRDDWRENERREDRREDWRDNDRREERRDEWRDVDRREERREERRDEWREIDRRETEWREERRDGVRDKADRRAHRSNRA